MSKAKNPPSDLSATAASAEAAAESLHRATLRCLGALAELSGRVIGPELTDDELSEMFKELRAAVDAMPPTADDPLSGPVVIKAWGLSVTSWHGIVSATAKSWAARDYLGARTSAAGERQTNVLPMLSSPDPGEMRAEL